MRKGKFIIKLATLAALLLVSVGTTLAVLSAISGPVTTTFVIGDIDLALEETAGAEYKLLPGTEVALDTRVTVRSGSVDCWLFIRLNRMNDADGYLDYAIADGWTLLDGYDGVYYRSVSDSEEDATFQVIKGDSVTVKDTLTKEKLQAITNKPRLTVTAYAVQSHGIDTADAAWSIILTEE